MVKLTKQPIVLKLLTYFEYTIMKMYDWEKIEILMINKSRFCVIVCYNNSQLIQFNIKFRSNIILYLISDSEFFQVVMFPIFLALCILPLVRVDGEETTVGYQEGGYGKHTLKGCSGQKCKFY